MDGTEFAKGTARGAPVLKRIHSGTPISRYDSKRRIGQASPAMSLLLGAVALGGVALSGCAVRPARVEGTVVYKYPVVEAELVPVDVSRHPRVLFHDRYLYLIDGRWYYPTDKGWMILRDEPQELYGYRRRIARPRDPSAIPRTADPPLRAPPAPPPTYQPDYPNYAPDYPTPPPRRRP
jgi:hypothetical protein